MPEETAEQIKMRRWALEQLARSVPLDTTADIAQLLRAADALIHYVNTGEYPRITDGDGRETRQH